MVSCLPSCRPRLVLRLLCTCTHFLSLTCLTHPAISGKHNITPQVVLHINTDPIPSHVKCIATYVLSHSDPGLLGQVTVPAADRVTSLYSNRIHVPFEQSPPTQRPQCRIPERQLSLALRTTTPILDCCCHLWGWREKSNENNAGSFKE